MSTSEHSVLRWTLELAERPAETLVSPGPNVKWLPDISTDRYLQLYTRVGEPWKWCDRQVMPRSELQSLLAESDRAIGVLLGVEGRDVGFTEVRHHSPLDCEIVYFGLFPDCTGTGLGGPLLQQVIQHAVTQSGPDARIWLTTCEWDSPAALPFYQRMGFRVVREELHLQQNTAHI